MFFVSSNKELMILKRALIYEFDSKVHSNLCMEMISIDHTDASPGAGSSAILVPVLEEEGWICSNHLHAQVTCTQNT